MRTIPALLAAALVAGCAVTPAEMRQREPDARATLAGSPEVAAKCVGTKLPELRRFGDASYHVTADLLGVRMQCGSELCAVIDLRGSGSTTEATAWALGWPSRVTSAVREALDACAARS